MIKPVIGLLKKTLLVKISPATRPAVEESKQTVNVLLSVASCCAFIICFKSKTNNQLLFYIECHLAPSRRLTIH